MRPFGKSMHRWKGNFKMDLKECVDWSKVAEGRAKWQDLVNLQVPQMVGNFLAN
jgi:hypothetical protein